MMDASFLWDSSMKRAIVVTLGVGAVITSAAAIGIGAAQQDTAPQSMTVHEYHSAQRAVELDRLHAGMRCDALAEGAREVCLAEANGASILRAAEIESAYRRDQSSARALQRAKIEARYQVDRAQCGALGGHKRDRCLVRAHATKGRAMLEAAAPYEVKYTP